MINSIFEDEFTSHLIIFSLIHKNFRSIDGLLIGRNTLNLTKT